MRFVYFDDVTTERSLFEFDNKGIFASVKPSGAYGSHWEGFMNGEVQPMFRLNSYPSMSFEAGQGSGSWTDAILRRVDQGRFKILSQLSGGTVVTGNLDVANIYSSDGHLHLSSTAGFVAVSGNLKVIGEIQNTILNTFTQSLNGFTASFTASVQSIGDARYIQVVTGSDNFFVKQTLQVSGTIVNPVGHLHLSSSTGSTVAVSGNLKIQGEIYGYLASIPRYIGSTYTFSASDSGKIIELSATTGAAINCYLPENMAKGFNTTIVQFASASLIHFSRSGGSTLSSYGNLSKSAGWYSQTVAYVSDNSTGISASWIIGGALI